MVISNLEPDLRCVATEDSISYLRPSFIQFINCKNISLSDFTISNGPMCSIHAVYSSNIYANGLKVITEGVNNDGFVIDSSTDILIENCYFSNGDDCLVIKSGLNEDGWRVNKPGKNIVVQNCFTAKGHGGVVIGSEMSGGVENVLVDNCEFCWHRKRYSNKNSKGERGIY